MDKKMEPLILENLPLGLGELGTAAEAELVMPGVYDAASVPNSRSSLLHNSTWQEASGKKAPSFDKKASKEGGSLKS